MSNSQSDTIRAVSSQKPAWGHMAAIALMCGAVTIFALLDATAKYLVEVHDIPVVEVVWVRFLANALLTLALLLPRRSGNMAKSSKLFHQLGRSALLATTTVFNFAAVKYLQLDQTVTIFFLTPLLVAALAGPILGEWVGWRRLLAIMTGFVGVLLVTRPGFGGIHWAIGYSFAATACYALFSIYTRYLAQHDSAEVNLFYTPIAGTLIAAPFAIAVWVWPSDAFTWVLFASTGITATFGHWLMILSLKYAPAPVVAPFVYVGLISMSGLGYLVFGDIPTLWTLAGGAVVVSSGLYLLYRERHQKD
jgi:drug/metabolite transporter (DMT)-like permease